MNETYYIKKGKKYIPVGMSHPDMMGEGLWLIQFYEHSKSYKSLMFRVCDLPNPIDLQVLAKATLLEEIITKEISDAWGDGKFTSFAEVAQRIVGKLTTAESKFTIRKTRGS